MNVNVLLEQKESLLRQIKCLEEDKVMADGGAYSDITYKIGVLNNDLRKTLYEIRCATFVGPLMPEWVISKNAREAAEKASKARVAEAMKKMEMFFKTP